MIRHPRFLFTLLLIAALGAAGWIESWRARVHADGSYPKNTNDAAFLGLEQENRALRKQISSLEEALAKARQNASGELAIPTPVLDALKLDHPEVQNWPSVRRKKEEVIFRADLDLLEQALPKSDFFTLLTRCGLIDSRKSFLKQFAYARTEAARALATRTEILIAKDFDPESIPDQAELYQAILIQIDYAKVFESQGTLARLEALLQSRARCLAKKTRFQLRFAKAGVGLVPKGSAASTPLEELPLAIQRCILWQSEIAMMAKKAEPRTNPTGLGPIFLPILLDPLASGKPAKPPKTEDLTRDGDVLIWHLYFHDSTLATEAMKALKLYFSDWPESFGSAPTIECTSHADSSHVTLRFD